jgi:hypothetical protein
MCRRTAEIGEIGRGAGESPAASSHVACRRPLRVGARIRAVTVRESGKRGIHETE